MPNTVHWNKKMCIEYSTQMKSRFEEIMQAQNAMTPEEQQRYQMLLASLREQTPQEGV